MRIPDAVVLITGASSGIGRATALAFAERKAALVLAARREQALTELVRECEIGDVPALPVAVDVSDAAAVEELARRAVERFGRIDVWVNNAAVSVFAPFLRTPLEDFRRVIDVNLLGYVYGAHSALSRMRQQGSGVLVNVSSVVGVVAQPYTAEYSMSKAAIRSLGIALRSELRLDGVSGVKVCTVLPTTIDTPLFRQAANYAGRQVVPMPPVHSPQRVARAIVDVVRWPRREVVVGHVARPLILQHKLAPGIVERVYARQVDLTHLSRKRSSGMTSGNLYEPSPDQRDTATSGGWGGRRRTAQRYLATAALVAGTAAAIRRVRRN